MHKQLADYRDICLQESPAALLKHCGNAFLLQHAAAPQAPGAAADTRLLEEPEHAAHRPPQADFTVYELRASGRSPYPNVISVGRTDNNDVVIAHTSLSKLHALFKEEGEMMLVQDAGSTNGTFVNGEPVPGKGTGDPVKVISGDTLRLGDVSVTFLRASQLHDLVCGLFR